MDTEGTEFIKVIKVEFMNCGLFQIKQTVHKRSVCIRGRLSLQLWVAWCACDPPHWWWWWGGSCLY